MPVRLGAITLVVLLVAGLATWLLWPKPNREPFDQAVTNLAVAPAIHYRTTKGDPESTTDVKVTGDGDAVGTASRSGRQFHTLEVGDEVYVRSDKGVLASTGLPDAFLKDRWVTGSSGLTGSGAEQSPSPPQLARAFRGALDATTEFPPENEPGIPMAGTTALKATTPAGDLYVTKDAPYRVVRYVPHAVAVPSESFAQDPSASPATPPLPLFPPSPDDADDPGHTPGGSLSGPALPFPELGATDFPPMSSAAVDDVYAALEEGVDQLGEAIDTDIDIGLTGNLQLKCGPGGCTVTANVANNSLSASGGQLTAMLTATVAVEGQPAGGCTNRAVLPFTGGTISCVAASAGPVWAAVEARKGAAAQAEANAKAAARRGTLVRVPYQVVSTTEGVVHAMPQVDIGQERQRLGKKRTEANCLTKPNSFPAGTRVLLADGSTRPIEAIPTGTRVRTTDPVSGQTIGAPVLATIVGNGNKQLDEISVSDGRHPGKITATANHPFWSPDQRAWLAADSLRPGDRLYAGNGDTVRIDAIQPLTRAQPVYNLTVAHLHSYYVLAGTTPVLVHNSNCPRTGGFKASISPDEIAKINRSFGGETLLSGSPANTLANASRYHSFWDKSAVVIRDIAGGHMFNNGNKRTAQAVVEQLLQRNRISSGPTSAELRSIIDKVGKGQLHDVGDISAALRGY